MGSIIWLHSSTISPYQFSQLWFLALKPKYFRLVIPKGSFQPPDAPKDRSDREDTPLWFETNKSNQVVHPAQLQQSVEYVHQLIREETKLCATKDIIIGGHGHGGALALLAGVTYPEMLSGIVSVGGFLPPAVMEQEIANSASKEAQILLLHGVDDTKVPSSLGENSAERLKALDFQNVQFYCTESEDHEITKFHLETMGFFFGNYDNHSPFPKKEEVKPADDGF